MVVELQLEVVIIMVMLVQLVLLQELISQQFLLLVEPVA